jgi:hypothetical protein
MIPRSRVLRISRPLFADRGESVLVELLGGLAVVVGAGAGADTPPSVRRISNEISAR